MKTKTDVSATVLRAIKVLKHLKEMPGPQSVSYISKDLEMSPTIVHRLLTTLKMEGFVFQDAQSKLYSLGSVFLEYANKIVTELPFAPIVEPWLIQLRNSTGETAGFYTPNGHTRLCLMEYESQQEIRRSVGVGTQLPIYAGATGRALISFQPERNQTQILQSLSEEERDVLQAKLQATRQQGYAVSIEEISSNVSAISAPVFDHQKRVVGAISISGPAFRFNDEKMEEVIPKLLHATDEISKSFV
ncbi:IclR family transcriptional regulator [Virgibacillus halodenitrificans]|uniref:IclR family transcriptional regulator n=1 Tax=Virgibacillus halodenitrificans TaxID=1482 RepID=UPI002DBD13BB|nr:IclR family transcriptional regulator [Virgibacillus halodenitrificans]MEC2157707.1 IclR family transcriptional regulator [Virgibacillus halodenitrificans]